MKTIQGRKAGIITSMIIWGMVFFAIIFVTPIFFEIIFVSQPTGIEGFLVKVSPWVMLLVLLILGFKILTSGESVI